jgi:hypothetical protein
MSFPWGYFGKQIIAALAEKFCPEQRHGGIIRRDANSNPE